MRTRAGVTLGTSVVAVLCIAVIALDPSLLRSAAQNCEDAIRERRFPDAVTICTRGFESERRGEFAASVALAFLLQNKRDEAWKWANLPEANGHVRALRVRGVISVGRGEREDGRRMLEEALQFAIERGDPGEASRAAHALAGIHWDAGRYTAAYDAIEVSEREARRANDRPALALAELARGDIFRHLGDEQRSEDSYRRAIDATEQWPSDQAFALLKAGLAMLNSGSPKRAEAYFRRARSLAETTGNGAVLTASRLNLVRVLIVLRRFDEAAAELDSVPTENQGNKSGMRPLLRASIALGRNDHRQALIALDEAPTTSLNEKDQVDHLALRAKALVLSGRHAEAEEAWFEAIRLIEVLSARSPEQQGWVVSSRRGPFDDLFVHLILQNDHLRAWEVVTRYARAEALSLETSERSADPRSLVEAAESLRARWRPGSLDAPANTVLDADASQEVLVLHEAGDRLWAGVRRDGRVRFVEVGSSSEFETELEAFMRDPGRTAEADKLGTAIWRASALNASDAPLLVRVTGRLHRLAVAALRHDGRYWVELRSIARAPAVSPGEDLEMKFDGEPLLAGDPGGDLAGAREEVNWVARYLSLSALQGDAVTRAAVLSGVRRPLLHLATHATIALDGAHLVVADGVVTTHDILEERPSARLVVLASCASGTGREAAGSDSLATAFLRAGSGAVLATLRSVPDVATQKIIRAFYEAKGVQDPVTALARAQRSVIGTEPPSIWSSFVISLGPSYTVQHKRTIEAKR